MKTLIALFSLLALSTSFASGVKVTRIQAIEQLTQAPSSVDIQKIGFSKGLQVVAKVQLENCMTDESETCERTYQSGKISGLSVKDRDIYFNGTYCGNLKIFKTVELSSNCQLEVQKVTTCTEYVNDNDCTDAKTSYQVNLNVTAE